VEQCENACPGAALEGEYASRGGPDRCIEEPGATVEGDTGRDIRKTSFEFLHFFTPYHRYKTR